MAKTQPPTPPSGPAGSGERPVRRRAAQPGSKRVKAARNPILTEEKPILDVLKDEAKTSAPSWLISLGLHVVLLVVLALIVIHYPKEKKIPTLIGGWLGEYIGPIKGPRTAVEIESVKIEPEGKPDDPEEAGAIAAANARKKKAEPDSTGGKSSDIVSVNPSEVGVGTALSGRGTGARGGLVKTFGGSEKSEQTVGLGLNWLAKQQKGDGHWELHQGYPDPGMLSLKTDTGATALALLAFLGAGHTPQQGPYKDKVQKGINWLIKVQKPNGDLHDALEEGRQTSFYAHGQATIVLCEAYAITHDSELLPHVQKALEFIYASQHPTAGGWKYRPNSAGDLSVFGWQLMAIQSARMAQLPVPQEVLDRAIVFLDSVQEQEGSRYKYEPINPPSAVSPAMTAEGLLCRQYLGWTPKHPSMRNGIKYLLQDDNLPSWSNGRRNVYFWYYATQALHNIQGEEWEKWNGALRDELVKSQLKIGKQAGSWDPFKVSGAPKEHMAEGGRLYITSMCILMLEVYYRHLPLFKENALQTGNSQ